MSPPSRDHPSSPAGSCAYVLVVNGEPSPLQQHEQWVWGLGRGQESFGEALLCPKGLAASRAEPRHRSEAQGMLMECFLHLR